MVRMWSEGNIHALLVGINIGAATMENSMVVPKKIKNDTIVQSSNFTSVFFAKVVWKDIYTHMFIEALFTIAKIWKQPQCPSVDEWIKKICVYVCVHACVYMWV